MAMTPPPDLPARKRPGFSDTFSTWLTWFTGIFITELNAVIQAFNLNSLNGTSASTVTIGTGNKSFVASLGKSYLPGMYLILADAAAPTTNSMYGQVLSYDAGTGALVMNIETIKGSGSKSSWVISFTAPGGATNGYVLTVSQTQLATAYTTTGTAPAFQIDASPDYPAYAAKQVVVATFHAANAGIACSLSIDSATPVNIKQVDSSGAKVNPTFPSGFIGILMADGVDWIIVNPLVNSAVGELFDWPYADTPKYGLVCNGAAVSSATYSALFAKAVKTSVATITIASPAVITWTAHPLYINAPVKFTTTGALPTPLVIGTTYYLIPPGFGANSFQLSATIGGSAINTSGAQSGIHKAIHAPYGCANDLSTFNLPNIAADYTTVQAASNEGTSTIGELLTHTHGVPSAAGSGGNFGAGLTAGLSAPQSSVGMTPAGGAANKAAGLRVRKCIRF